MEGDSEANCAYYALHKLHKWPHEYLALSRQEKAFVIAAIQVKTEADNKKVKELEREAKNK